MAAWWTMASMSDGVGPVPVKVRPSRPRESQATFEPGPPERRPVVGWTTPSCVIVLFTEKTSSIALTSPSMSTPLTTR